VGKQTRWWWAVVSLGICREIVRHPLSVAERSILLLKEGGSERLEQLKSREGTKRKILQKEQIQLCSSYSSLLSSCRFFFRILGINSVVSPCWVVSVITLHQELLLSIKFSSCRGMALPYCQA
jgi:hypothetical protein